MFYDSGPEISEIQLKGTRQFNKFINLIFISNENLMTL